MQFPYTSTLFSIYECKISEMCEPFITRICINMKPINFEENGRFQVDNDPLAMGTSLFELYMGIQKFVEYVIFLQFFTRYTKIIKITCFLKF